MRVSKTGLAAVVAIAGGIPLFMVGGDTVLAQQAPQPQPATPAPKTTNTKPADDKAKANLPNIKILATGGTIAGAGESGGYGYTSGQFKVEDLISAVPDLDKLANLSGEQVANIGSQDMNDKVWLKLAE